MIAPGSIADWTLFAGMLSSLSALAASSHRWVLRETEIGNMTTVQCGGALRFVPARAQHGRS